MRIKMKLVLSILLTLGLALIVVQGMTLKAKADGPIIICMENEQLKKGGNVWMPSASLLELPRGQYRLDSDISIANTIYLKGDVTLDLNGKTITMSGSDAVITVSDDYSLNLYDNGTNGTIQHSSSVAGSGIDILYGNVNMYGGKITNNSTANDYSGGGVSINGGTFNMYGGEISHNSAKYGGGVKVRGNSNGSLFNMYGGKIINNSATLSGGGVYVAQSNTGKTVFSLSGNPEIENNDSATGGKNVYLYNDYNKDAIITIKGTLTNTSSISVLCSANKPYTFTKGYKDKMGRKDPSLYFQSEEDTYSVSLDVNGEVEMGVPVEIRSLPEAISNLIANGSAQELVNAGTAEGGIMNYALGTNATTAPTGGWSTDIPTGKEEGTYYVWYKVIGDADHIDSKPVCIVVKIIQGEIKTNVTQEENTPTADVTGLDSDLAESVMNEDEKAQFNSGADMTLTLEMTNIDQTVKEDEKNLTEDALKKVDRAAAVGMYFDISLILRIGSNYQRSVTEMGNKAITVRFEIPQNLRAAEGVNRTFYLMHIHQGVAKQIASTKSDSMQVSLNQLSTFALAYSDESGNAGFYSGLKITQKKGKIKVSWDKTEGVSKYGVFITYCGKDYPKKAVKTTKNNSVTFKNINGKKIDFSKNIKIYVEAFDNNGASVGKSITGHVAGKNSKKNKNPKSISVSKKNLTLSTGATSKIKATVKMEKGDKKAFKDDHVAKLRYRSTDVSVAKVDKKGKVTAVGAGSCQIYVYAQNGLAVKVSVTVN